MKPRHTTLAILVLAFLAIGAVANAQTIRSLAYNATNFTVLGPTNTNALVFTNVVVLNNGVWTGPQEDALRFDGADIYYTTNWAFSFTSTSILVRQPLQWADPGSATNAFITRSNLFGAPGLSATITNGGLVYVFTNGILASTNAP